MSPPADLPAHRLTRDAADLAALAALLEREPRHALDTESNSGFVYSERLCLLQLNVGGELWLVDLTELPAGTTVLEPLRPALESASTSTLLHGGEFDVGCLKRDYGIALGGIWDTQQAASFLGWPKTGYAAVVERVCGVELEKGQTHQDWGRRPLTPEMLSYALDDVRYLPEVGRALAREIAAADLEEELAIANRAVEEATWEGGHRPDGFWKLRGAGKLSPEALACLARLWEWRDRVAREEDRPPGRTLNNRVLLAVSRSRPRSLEALRRLGVPARVAGPRGRQLLRLIDEARGEPPPRRPRPAKSAGDAGARRGRVRERERLLKRWRAREAERRGVPPQVVLPARAVEHLKHRGAADLEGVPQLGGKRLRLYGEQLRELLE